MAKKKDTTTQTANGDSNARGYTVLARRYRSRDFDELVGQEPISRTLKHAIECGRTAHAYLFCGTRGVGKTSMARIFAKALNVTPDLNECQAVADAILRGDDLDVIEIDGASNRGIDQARELIANAGLSPSRCRYKIYIIDEVHMLTKESFNALLKTMEEPPSHVKFILCTTEPHKVPMTIQSRCQRFEFRALSTARITEQLKRIVEAEGMDADESALHLLARLGKGSMRDSLSLLDRVLSAGRKKLTDSVLEEVLGLPDQTLVLRLTDSIIAADAKTALEIGGELLARGASIEQALEVLIDHLRELMVLATCGSESELAELTDEVRAQAQQQATHFDPAGFVHCIAMCDSVARSVRNSSASRALFDALLVRLCMAEHLASIPALLSGAAAALPKAPAKASPAEKKNEPGPPPKREAVTDAGAAPPRSTLAELKPALAPRPEFNADSLWEQVLANAQSQSDLAKLEHLSCESFDGRTARLVLDAQGVGMSGFLQTQTAWLSSLLERVAGRPVRVELATPSHEIPVQITSPAEQISEASRIPIVRRAMDLFDATIVAVLSERAASPSASQNHEEPSRV